jgi:hypothetical protein
MNLVTAALLTCGIVAGAMLPTVLWIDGATRPGYSLWHHGASQLGLGERASLQTGNFVLGGILVVGFPSAYVVSCGQDAARIGARPCLPPRASGSSRRE